MKLDNASMPTLDRGHFGFGFVEGAMTLIASS